MSAEPRVSCETERSAKVLVSTAVGPNRYEVLGGPTPDLTEAFEAIDVIATLETPGSADLLMEVIEKTDWFDTLERAVEAFLRIASVDQLCRIGRYFFRCFWQPGDYGGGEVTEERLNRVADRLNELGYRLRDSFPEHERGRLDSQLASARPMKPK